MSTTSLGEYLLHARLARGMSQRQLATRAGISNTEIKRIEDGTRKKPSQEILAALATELQLDPLDLYAIAGYTIVARETAPAYTTHATPVDNVQVPVYHTVVASEAARQANKWITLPARDTSDGEYFFVEVGDDGMAGSYIPQGGCVLVRQQRWVENGAIALVAIGDQPAIVRYVSFLRSFVSLQTANPAFPPQLLRRDEVTIIGKVVRSIISFA